MRELSWNKKRALNYIIEHIEEHGLFPTNKEICEAIGCKSSEASYYVKSLYNRGYLVSDGSGKSFSVAVNESVSEKRKTSVCPLLPFIDNIIIDKPIRDSSTVSKWVPVAENLVSKSRGAFAYRMTDDSMIYEHINRGDVLVIRPALAVDDESIALVLNGVGTSIRRVTYLIGGDIKLIPGNPVYPLRRVRIEDNCIIGKVVAVLRGEVVAYQ